MDKLFSLDDSEIYGSHNCHINAFTLLMKYHDLDLKPLYIYNFNVNIGKNDHHFGGNVSYRLMIELIKKVYKIYINELTFQKIPLNEIVILPIDSYDLPYIENKNEIEIGMQIHYVLAMIKSDGKLHIYDPYYKKYHKCEIMTMTNSWNVFRQPIVQFFRPNVDTKKILEYEYVEPYLLNMDYKEEYIYFSSKLKNMLKPFSEEGFNNNEMYKRFFACFKSMLIIRKKHFSAFNNQCYIFNEIIKGYSNILREMCKISLKPKTELANLFNTLDHTFELEIEYLNKYHFYENN